MKIIVKEHFNSAFSQNKAMVLREEIQKCLNSGEDVCIDFEGITRFTTLFFNFSTGYFVSLLGPVDYNKRIKVINLNELGESTYRSSYDNATEKYGTDKTDIIAKIVNNPED